MQIWTILAGRFVVNMDAVERSFAGGKVFAPIAGVVATNVAYAGQSLVAGAPIAEILDATDIFVDWYIPNKRFADPRIDDQVMVVFGNRRIPGTIFDILPVSDVYAGRQPQFGGDRQSTQIARIRSTRARRSRRSIQPSPFTCTTRASRLALPSG